MPYAELTPDRIVLAFIVVIGGACVLAFGYGAAVTAPIWVFR